MTRNERIIILTAAVGLVADAITITGLLSGFVIPKPEVSVFLSKSAMSVISIALNFYFEAVILVFIFKFYDYRMDVRRIKRLSKDSKREGFVVLTFSYSIWTPPYLLWLLWVFANLHGFFLTVLGLFGIILGGFLLALFSSALYEVLFPFDVDFNSTQLNNANAADSKSSAAD